MRKGGSEGGREKQMGGEWEENGRRKGGRKTPISGENLIESFLYFWIESKNLMVDETRLYKLK